MITEDQTALIGAPGKFFNSFLILEKKCILFGIYFNLFYFIFLQDLTLGEGQFLLFQ
jgi:hypothetical protein